MKRIGKESANQQAARVKRYRRGKAPDWAHDDHDQQEEEIVETPNFIITRKQDDPRLTRLARVLNLHEARADHLRIRREEKEKEDVFDSEEKDNDHYYSHDDDDDDEIERERIKEKSLRTHQADDDEEIESDDDVEDDESEYSETETEAAGRVSGFETKPVWTVERVTIQETKEPGRALTRTDEEKKRETKEIVIRMIKEDGEMTMNSRNDNDDVDDNDDVAAEEEYTSWRQREIARVKRDRDPHANEEGVGPIRKLKKQKKKKKMLFMQRDYHKGCFFQSDDGDDRDYSAPTGEDKMDKAALPKVMRVKGFGLRGQTKWTHLANEDTTFISGSGRWF